MQLYKRHKINALILLVIMVVQMGAKSFHHHTYTPSATIECDDCQQHRVHSGHFTAATDSHEVCTLCQLLTVPYLAGKECVITSHPNHTFIHHPAYVATLQQRPAGPVCLRGPPTV